MRDTLVYVESIRFTRRTVVASRLTLLCDRILGDSRLAAPALLDLELVNVCRTKIRRNPAEKDSIRASLRAVRSLAVETIEINHIEALDLALATGLTAYDASYLWLARTLGAELITLDRKLAAASV
jgi:predicted nucleic acid-binding protein